MATLVDESTVKLDPKVVGNAFAEHYYNTLSKSPELLHNFYNDASLLGRPGSDGSVSPISTLEEIKKLILSLDYKNCLVEIQTIDSQESYENGVMVLVTGFFAGKDSTRQKFTQAFFLVPQDDGRRYYVLNDIFRYMEESENKKISDEDNIAPATPVIPCPGREPTSIPNRSVSADLSTTLEEGDDQAKESGHPLDNGEIPTCEKEVVVEKVVTTQDDAHPVSEAVASGVQEEDAPKKSYASVANALNFKTQPFQQRVSPVKPVKQSHTAVPSVVSSQQTGYRPPSNNSVEINNNSAAVEGYSIFVANLPLDATVDQLVQTFTRFGAIKPSGVQVRSYKQDKNCFGFVEFESADSVEKALEVSTVMIGTRTAHIERKNAKNGGEKYPSRKGGFRNGNFRSRGNLNGGHGYGRNDFENQGRVSGQSWGTTGRHGEANKKVYLDGEARGPRQARAGNN
ncbi:PREDICTED: ras GTPase-activating protein-binding protein 1-like isoform X2 [Populus euphratica]|uniref:Ras GTPase-activating protein-binding protein 1-like isoform X2 n=1 Tax=Populus euphratica TaxID=75702 RepID=A0AAJ6TI92_POPEU|nr:PREDICTED: ras GTPase-activating protein-binding protein 1-like isoform X2 [Populus euphratica]